MKSTKSIKIIATILVLVGVVLPIAYHLDVKYDAEKKLDLSIKENGGEWPKGFVSESSVPNKSRILFLSSGNIEHDNLIFFDPLQRSPRFATTFVLRINDDSICEVAVDGKAKVLSGPFIYNMKRKPLLSFLSIASVLAGSAFLLVYRKR